jgi:hypothetical protein
MRSIVVKDNQSLFDICLQLYGTINAIVAFSLSNNMALTDTITAGEELNTPEGMEIETKVLKYYQANKITPATAQLSPDIASIVEQYEALDDDSTNTVYGREYTIEYKTEFGNQL